MPSTDPGEEDMVVHRVQPARHRHGTRGAALPQADEPDQRAGAGDVPNENVWDAEEGPDPKGSPAWLAREPDVVEPLPAAIVEGHGEEAGAWGGRNGFIQENGRSSSDTGLHAARTQPAAVGTGTVEGAKGLRQVA